MIQSAPTIICELAIQVPLPSSSPEEYSTNDNPAFFTLEIQRYMPSLGRDASFGITRLGPKSIFHPVGDLKGFGE